MTAGEWQRLGVAWDWDPTIVAGCLGLLVAYGLALRFRLTLQATAWAGGVLVLLLSLVSPIDALGDTYLFSAHMLQHLLLVLVVPPLLLLGVPAALWERLLRWRPADVAERVLGRPGLAWALGVATLWIWHAPPLYNAALASEGVHAFEHLCFLMSATIFWWPIVAPVPERRRLGAWAAIGYLVMGALVDDVLGILLTFAPAGLYPAYLHPADVLGILPGIRDGWGLTAAVDQQLGGILMWIPTSAVYLTALIALLTRWFGEPEDDLPAVLAAEPGATGAEVPAHAH